MTTNEARDAELEATLQLLGLQHLREHWDECLEKAKTEKPSYYRFLSDLVREEGAYRREKLRLSRIKRAKITEPWVMNTFPFDLQPNLKKRFVLELYDSLDFMKKPQDLIFIGPTGCGKSGLATSYLTHALNQGYRGYWIDFKDLLDLLWRAIADHTDKKVIKRFADISCLAIDELGYAPIRKEQAGLFFDLMKRRHKKKTTLITTQLGYEEWADFLQNKHLTAALLDRMTENCTVFNMRRCISIRPKNVRHATKEDEP
jgi:DNA replication protein DnaC